MHTPAFAFVLVLRKELLGIRIDVAASP